MFTANLLSHSVSIIDLANANTVTNVPLLPSGGDAPLGIAFDAAGQRVFTANANSDSVSIIVTFQQYQRFVRIQDLIQVISEHLFQVNRHWNK